MNISHLTRIKYLHPKNAALLNFIAPLTEMKKKKNDCLHLIKGRKWSLLHVDP
jgi:hypothetical protein